MIPKTRKEAFKALGLLENANKQEIKKAYHRLALKWHPDKQSSKSQEEKDIAAEKTKEITVAYGILTGKIREKFISQQPNDDWISKMSANIFSSSFANNEEKERFFETLRKQKEELRKKFEEERRELAKRKEKLEEEHKEREEQDKEWAKQQNEQLERNRKEIAEGLKQCNEEAERNRKKIAEEHKQYSEKKMMELKKQNEEKLKKVKEEGDEKVKKAEKREEELEKIKEQQFRRECSKKCVKPYF